MIPSALGAAPAFDGLPALERHLRAIHAPFGRLTDAQWAHLAATSARRLPDGQWALHYDPAIATPILAAEPADADLSPFWAGVEVPVRPSMGLLTQPISCIGLPVIAAPVLGFSLPIGVQLIAAPWREDVLFRAAALLEQLGVCGYVTPGGR